MRLWQGLAAGPDPAPGLRHGGIAGRSDRPAAAEGLAARVDLARARGGKAPCRAGAVGGGDSPRHEPGDRPCHALEGAGRTLWDAVGGCTPRRFHRGRLTDGSKIDPGPGF